MKKKIMAFIGLAMMLILSACGTTEDMSTDELSKVYYDEAANYVEIYVKYNEKAQTACTEYGIATESGSESNNSIFVAMCNEEEFYNALLALGLKPTKSLEKNRRTGCKASGILMEVYITKDDTIDFSFSSLVKTKNKLGYSCKFVFSGNIETVKKSGTGGILALDSCVNSIISNSEYGYGYLNVQKLDEFYSSNKKIGIADGEILKARFFQSSET